MSGVEFTIRRKILTVFGAKFHIYKPDGGLLGFCKQKAFRLREDIRIYTDETMQKEKLRIAARQILDFSASYDVVESESERKIGTLRRKGLSSLFRDSWIVLDPQEAEIGRIQEDSTMLAVLRRVVDLGFWIPQTFHLYDHQSRELAQFRTHFNPFVHRMTVTVFPECPVDPLLVLAGGLVLMAVEGRQD